MDGPQPLDPSTLQSPEHDSLPTMPVPDALLVRVGEGEEVLKQIRVQAHIDASAFLKLLSLLEELAPLALAAAAG